MRFVRWYLGLSLATCVALPAIALVVGAIARVSLTDALVPILGLEFYGLFWWLPLTLVVLGVWLGLKALVGSDSRAAGV